MLRRTLQEAAFALAWVLLVSLACLVALAKHIADEDRRQAELCAARPAPQCEEARR